MRRRILTVLVALVAALLPAVPAAAAPPGTFTDLGAKVTGLTIMQGVLGKDAAGRDAIYAVPAGENAALNVVDAHSRTLEKTVPLPGASGAWAITVASDGTVYVGSYSTAHLYAYHPATDEVADLGQPVAGEQFVYGLTAGDDGVVYGGTYPHAHAFRYDPASGYTDYGSLDSVQQYARSAAYDPDDRVLYVGLATPAARLFRIDVATGAHTEITPAGLTGGGFSDLGYADGVLFGNVDSKLITFDAATGDQLSIVDGDAGTTGPTYPLNGRGVSPAHDGKVWFTTSGNVLASYDTATRTATRATVNGSPVVSGRGAGIGYGWGSDGLLYGLAGNYSGGTFSFDPATTRLTSWTSPFAYVPAPLADVLAGPDGTVWLSAFLNGQTASYDPATGATTQPVRLGQVEDWAFAGDTLYAGTYPYGRVTAWKPGGTATDLFSLEESDEQNRPVALVPHDGTLYVGTTPGYGVHGGALTTYDLTSKALSVHRDVIADQTVAALVFDGDTLWGGSSIDGGQGTTPIADQATLFSWDPATGRKTGTYTPVPGARSINALTVGPDGLLWGLADGTVFVFDPRTHKVKRTTTVFAGTTGAQDGALVWHPDGDLYGVTGGRLFRVDAHNAEATVLRDHGLLRLTLAPDGTMYTLLAPDGYTNQTDLASYRPH
jgi:streptogramin lyase